MDILVRDGRVMSLESLSRTYQRYSWGGVKHSDIRGMAAGPSV